MAFKKKTTTKVATTGKVANNIAAHEDEAPATTKKVATTRKASSRSDSSGSVYKIIEVVGSSPKSWEHAAQVAISRASQTLQDLRIAEVVDQDLKIEDGKIAAYRTKLRMSFKFRD